MEEHQRYTSGSFAQVGGPGCSVRARRGDARVANQEVYEGENWLHTAVYYFLLLIFTLQIFIEKMIQTKTSNLAFMYRLPYNKAFDSVTPHMGLFKSMNDIGLSLTTHHWRLCTPAISDQQATIRWNNVSKYKGVKQG